MKPKKQMVVQVPANTARRLYHQGHKICTSHDGYTTQEQAQQIVDPVSESFFQQDCVYGFVVPEQESEPIRKFQKEGIINMSVAALSGMVCMNFLFIFTFFKNYWSLGAFLALSYLSIHYWVKVFDSVRRENNPYLQMMDKYNISLSDEE